jgi:hypothetical protein
MHTGMQYVVVVQYTILYMHIGIYYAYKHIICGGAPHDAVYAYRHIICIQPYIKPYPRQI